MDARIITSSWVVIGGAIAAASTPAYADSRNAPRVMLANVYEDADVDVTRYWLSEKLDGIRAYWDGEKLWTRHGNLIHAPDWFTRDLPASALDGELWAGHNRFEFVSSVVLDADPQDVSWHEIRFMVFDLPQDAHPFERRLASLTAMRDALPAFVQIVDQRRIKDRDELLDELHRVVASGGEGLMLHRADSLYKADRSDDLLKMKPARDAEARVVDYTPGKGKYAGQVGALVVETRDGIRFSVGSGLSDHDRIDPPKVGSWITYRYQALTIHGVPRFARFVRVRAVGSSTSDL
jgi:DNA ligase